MTAAIIYAFASAGFLGAGVVLAQLGLRTVKLGLAVWPSALWACLKHIEITARIVAGTALTVLGVILVLIG